MKEREIKAKLKNHIGWIKKESFKTKSWIDYEVYLDLKLLTCGWIKKEFTKQQINNNIRSQGARLRNNYHKKSGKENIIDVSTAQRAAGFDEDALLDSKSPFFQHKEVLKMRINPELQKKWHLGDKNDEAAFVGEFSYKEMCELFLHTAPRQKKTLDLLIAGVKKTEIAKKMGISQPNISQIISKLQFKAGHTNNLLKKLPYLWELQLKCWKKEQIKV